MTPSLRLRVLGTPGIGGPSGPLAGPVAQGQPLALLAVLACAGEPGIGREKLSALFWPDSTSYRAAHRLSQLLHHVRRCLDCGDLILGSVELRLEPARIACDLWDFAAARRHGELERAVELYAGPFLDGFFLADAAEFERWTESRRAALAREYRETLEGLAVQAEVRGDSRAAAAWWQRLGEQEPLSSRVTMHLMTALAAAGERARALEQAHAYQIRVRQELEAEPNPAVGALAEQLRHAPPRRADGASDGRQVAIGILPLVALDQGLDARELAQGLTEELMTAAAAAPGLRVAARTSLAALQVSTGDVREIGARLGLAAVLEGSVRCSSGRVRLTVRLVDTRDGCHLWTGRFERELEEGLASQDALAREVVEAILPSLARPSSA
jgi:TolB-like protein